MVSEILSSWMLESSLLLSESKSSGDEVSSCELGNDAGVAGASSVFCVLELDGASDEDSETGFVRAVLPKTL